MDRNNNSVCDFEDSTTTTVLRTTSSSTTSTTKYIDPGPQPVYVGYFDRLEVSKQQVFVNEPVEIKATFLNQGDPATVSFKGRAESGGRIMGLIQSAGSVARGGNVTLTAYFIPTEAGSYRIIGRIYYESSSTIERSITIKAVKKT